MRTGLAVLLFISICDIGIAGDWSWRNPQPQGNTIWKTSFPGGSSGFAVGNYGTILATYDGGQTWQLQYEAITDNLRDVYALDSLTAWFVGDNGDLYRTTNGGDHWDTQDSKTTNGLNAVFFYDKVNGWAGGDASTLLHTTDGGSTWSPQQAPNGLPNPNSLSFNGIFFTSATEGWAVGSNGAIIHTTNGGASWTIQQSSGQSSCLRVKFNTALSGFVLGTKSTIYRTTNGGASWSQTAPTVGLGYGFNDILFLSSNEILIAGDNGTLLRSLDGGATWNQDPLTTYASINGLALSGNTTIAVGEYGFIARKIGTNPWAFINSGLNRSANWITTSDGVYGLAAGQDGLILKTTDGGSTWAEISNSITLDSFYGIASAGRNFLWIVGDLGVLLASTDGGTTWVQQTTNTSNTLLSVSFIDNANGWAVGAAGQIIHTSDGGITWSAQPSGQTAVLFGVKFTDALHGWIVGDLGLILRTADGGQSWLAQQSTVSTALFNIDFVDAQNGFCAGASGVILKTTNGGATWTRLASNTQSNVYVVTGTTINSIWAAGDSGLVLRSTNGGISWNQLFALTGYSLYGLRAISDTVAWISGDNETVLTNGSSSLITGVTEGPSQSASSGNEEFQLRQNFPNPFNPSTAISYQQLAISFVTLRVYDVLGREVAKLVDEVRRPGAYISRWDGSSQPSGVYFYRLEAHPTDGGKTGDFIATRKMILIK